MIKREAWLHESSSQVKMSNQSSVELRELRCSDSFIFTSSLLCHCIPNLSLYSIIQYPGLQPTVKLSKIFNMFSAKPNNNSYIWRLSLVCRIYSQAVFLCACMCTWVCFGVWAVSTLGYTPIYNWHWRSCIRTQQHIRLWKIVRYMQKDNMLAAADEL